MSSQYPPVSFRLVDPGIFLNTEVPWSLVRPLPSVSSEKIIEEMKSLGLRPGTLEEALIIRRLHPRMQSSASLVVLDERSRCVLAGAHYRPILRICDWAEISLQICEESLLENSSILVFPEEHPVGITHGEQLAAGLLT